MGKKVWFNNKHLKIKQKQKFKAKFFGVFSIVTPSREVSLQVGAISKVENL